MTSTSRQLALIALTCAAVACQDGPPPETQRRVMPLAIPGPWVIPESTLAIGDEQDVPYAGAGPWNDGAACEDWLLPGTVELRDYLTEHFPQISHMGGYNCRPISGTNTLSLHGTGRALDIHIDLSNNDADNELGDPIANWLIENAEYIGIQYIIWDQWTWMASRPDGDKDRSYGGASPHIDHLHIELSVDAAAQRTAFFNNPKEPPAIEPCAILGPEGGVVDEAGPCFSAFGPSQYWREVTGQGYEGRLLWTNAFSNDNPSNWARWYLYFEEGGDYAVDVYTGVPEYAVYDATRYGVRYAGGAEESVIIDQSAAGEWKRVGVFPFEAGVPQHLDLYDNYAATVPADQHITADAVRLTRVRDTPPPEDTSSPDVVSDTSPPEDTRPAEDTSPEDTSAPDTSTDTSQVADGAVTSPPGDTGTADAAVDAGPDTVTSTAEACACRSVAAPAGGSPLAPLAALLGGLGFIASRRRRD